MQQTQQKALGPNPADMYMGSIASILKEMSEGTKRGDKILDAIKGKFDDIKNVFSSSVQKIMNMNIMKIAGNDGSAATVAVLVDIHSTLLDLTKFLEKNKKGKDTPNKKAKPSEADSSDELVIGQKIDIKSLSELIDTMRKGLNTKLFKLMDRFNNALDKMVSFDSKKVGKFNGGIIKLTEVLTGIKKIIEPVTKSMLFLVGALTVLSLLAFFPGFALSILLLGGFLSMLKKYMDDTKLPKNMMDFGIGVAAMVIGLMLMSFVDWMSIGKMIVFIAGLGLVFRLFSKGGMTLPKQIMEFGVGIGLLTLALVAFAYVEWGSIFKMLVFIGLLGIILKKFNGTGNAKLSPMLALAMGMGIMVLAILAFNELPIIGMLKLIGFILALGLAIAGINKLGGNTAMSGLPGFAFGLGLMVLAMYAMKDLPLITMGITLAFIALLGLALKLYNPASGMMMLMIGGGILAISAAFWVFKQTGFTLMDALVLAGSIALISAVIVGLGALVELIIPGAIAMVAVGVASIIFAGVLALISMMNINVGNVGNFILAAGILAAGFIALTPLAALALAGALLFIPISASALVAALALFAISKLTITPKAIDAFKYGLTGIISAYNSFGLIELGKAVAKAALVTPIILSALVVAGLFKVVESIDAVKASNNLIIMYNTLTRIFASLETWKNDRATDSIKNIASLVDSFKDLDNVNFKEITTIMSIFLNNLSDDKKWDSINKNMISLKNNIKDIVTNINMLNLSKALAFERNLKLLADKSSTDNLKIIIEKLREMIGLLYEQQTARNTQYQAPAQESAPQMPSAENNLSIVPNQKTTQQQLFDPNENHKHTDNLVDALENMLENLTLKVELAGNSNKI